MTATREASAWSIMTRSGTRVKKICAALVRDGIARLLHASFGSALIVGRCFILDEGSVHDGGGDAGEDDEAAAAGEEEGAGAEPREDGEPEKVIIKLPSRNMDDEDPQYPDACFPDSWYEKVPALKGNDESQFWQGWAMLRLKTFRLIENKYFETAVIIMILLSSLALVSGIS